MTERDRAAKVQLKLRLPEHIRARLAEEAKRNGYSLNHEIVRRLDISLSLQDAS